MHLYFITRGSRRFTRNFIDHVEDVYLPYEVEKEKKAMLQLIPREVKVWECAFPEKQLDKVMELIGTQQYDKYGILKVFVKSVAKVLKLKLIPKKYKNIFGSIPRDHCAVHLLGLKKDKFLHGIEQV